MATYWRCNDCETLHRGNPQRCSNCGNTVLSIDDSPGAFERIPAFFR